MAKLRYSFPDSHSVHAGNKFIEYYLV